MTYEVSMLTHCDLKDLKYMKKGWLLKQRVTEMDWVKHWFVLSGSALKFYKDSRAEELDILDGVIDLSKCRSVNEVNISRNYGFLVKVHILLKGNLEKQNYSDERRQYF